MSGWLRRAGQGIDATGSRVTWSVAQGRRGRRWREVRVGPDGAVLSSLLLETDPDGRFSHFELSTTAGLLTLHPEGDGTVHGNTITAAGVGHVRGLAWEPDGIVELAGSPIAAAAAAGTPGRTDGAAPGDRLVLVIDLELGIRTRRDPAVAAIALDDDGLPVLGAGEAWPLEE